MNATNNTANKTVSKHKTTFEALKGDFGYTNGHAGAEAH